MNVSTVLGLVVGIAVFVVAVVQSAVDPMILWNPPGLLLVIGGTVASTFISFQMRDVIRSFWVFWIVLKNERIHSNRDMAELLQVAKAWARHDIRAASQEVDRITNPFLRLGLELAIDNTLTDSDVVETLRWRIEKLKSRERSEAAVLRAMAAYSPAFGMLGTLLGLINMLSGASLDDFSLVSSNMAVALMTTLYGILLANMLFKPIAIKIEHRTIQRVAFMNMILEGILLMRCNKTPGVIREVMGMIMSEHPDELRDQAAKP